LVDPECVGLLIPTVRVLARGVVCVEADRTVLVKRDKICVKVRELRSDLVEEAQHAR